MAQKLQQKPMKEALEYGRRLRQRGVTDRAREKDELKKLVDEQLKGNLPTASEIVEASKKLKEEGLAESDIDLEKIYWKVAEMRKKEG